MKDAVFSRLGYSELPQLGDGRYQFVALIEKNSSWHFRSTFGKGDYGTFCDPRLACFVSLYGKAFPSKTREDVWAELGIVDIDRLPEECLGSPRSEVQSSADSSHQIESYALRPRNGTWSSAEE
jgi:hypothetical protein